VQQTLTGRVALVAGATRGAGRGIAVELGAAGATVYVTGRSTRERRSEYDRPETIEETAELVTQAGGHGIAVAIMMAQSVKTPNRATIRAGCSFPHYKTLHKSERRMRAMPEPVQASRPHHARSRPRGGQYR
jgi:NAD(P)-dependent dehydrogenase (short-subunit alcohol dehydrogenase family)